jgi:hypothetical protein
MGHSNRTGSPKTVLTTGTFDATTIDGKLDGTISGATIGELMGFGEWGGAGAWEGGGIGVEAGSFQGGGEAVIEGVQAIEYTHDLGQVTTSGNQSWSHRHTRNNSEGSRKNWNSKMEDNRQKNTRQRNLDQTRYAPRKVHDSFTVTMSCH